MNTEKIKEKIQTIIHDAKIEISGQDCSFSICIISPQFEGISMLNRQKKIMGLFQPELSTGKLHALSLKTYTVTEFEKINH